jgi:predicted nucleic acid-binding protein
MPFYDNAILIDTSASIALHNPNDRFHEEAKDFFIRTTDFLWVVINLTKFETYTRARYDSGFQHAITLYDFLTSDKICQISIDSKDEIEAVKLLKKYHDQDLSFHDAICAVVMKRIGIFRTFSFDKHFQIIGFEVFPGMSY